VGAFTDQKRHDLVINAVSKLNNVNLIIAGGGGNKKKEIKELEENEQTEFKSIIYKNKEFRIYNWENKPISELVNKDFTSKIKGYRLSDFQKFNKLIENKEIELEVWKVYFTKHLNKLQHNKKYCLSGCYLGRYSNLGSGSSRLSDSYGNGRVVLVRNLK